MKPPKIPGEVFKINFVQEHVNAIVIAVFTVIAFYAYLDMGMSFELFVSICFLAVLALYTWYERKLLSVYISPTYLRAEYKGIQNKIKYNLDHCFLYIAECTPKISGASTYRYQVCLVYKKNVDFSAHIEGKNVTIASGDQGKNKSSRIRIVKLAVTTEDNLYASIRPHSPRNDSFIITVADNIMCPVDLQKWVASFQDQIEKPLPMLFSSEQIRSDYQTGVFKS